MLHFALLDASLGTPHAKRNFPREIDARLTVFDVNEGDLPPGFDGSPPPNVRSSFEDRFDAVVISGSQSSVYDDCDWIRHLSAWVRKGIDRKIPMLGVCWGHQLLAQVLGGRVEEGAYELGYTQVDLLEKDPFCDGVSSPATVFATHSDHVVEMPPGATVLARNEASIQSFRSGSVVTCQFHPEYDLETAEAMIRSKSLPQEDVTRAMATCTAENVKQARAVKRVFRNFEHLVIRQSDVHRVATADRILPATNRS